MWYQATCDSNIGNTAEDFCAFICLSTNVNGQFAAEAQ